MRLAELEGRNSIYYKSSLKQWVGYHDGAYVHETSAYAGTYKHQTHAGAEPISYISYYIILNFSEIFTSLDDNKASLAQHAFQTN